MARKNDFVAVEQRILGAFNKQAHQSFSEKTLTDFFSTNREDWKISESKTKKMFVDFLLKQEILRRVILTDQDGKQKTIFSRTTTENEFSIFTALHSNAYYTHYSALFLNQLTLQIPKAFYLNFEHSSIPVNQAISQEAIDQAFSKEQRKAKKYFIYNGKKIFVVNGKNTEKLGVLQNVTHGYEYTDLERTLIDISIRPSYSGGVFEVLEAYKKAKRKADPQRLYDYLKQLKYIYPYHQVIGFYLEKAGYDEKTLKLFEKDIEFKFYLTYNIKNKEFSKRWNLYYPKGF